MKHEDLRSLTGRQEETLRKRGKLAYLPGPGLEASIGTLPLGSDPSGSSSTSSRLTVVPPGGSASYRGGGRRNTPPVISNQLLTNHSFSADKPGLPRTEAVHLFSLGTTTTGHNVTWTSSGHDFATNPEGELLLDEQHLSSIPGD